MIKLNLRQSLMLTQELVFSSITCPLGQAHAPKKHTIPGFGLSHVAPSGKHAD